TEEAYLPDRPILALLEYKNLKNIWLRAVPAPQDFLFWQDLLEAQQREYLRNQPAVWQERLSAPDPGDYTEHSMEFKIPALPTGRWIIQAAETPEFDPKTGYVTTCMVSVSGLAAMMHNEEDKVNLWVVDRAEGAPRAGVRADLFSREWNNKQGRSEWIFQSSLQSDSEGRIRLATSANNRSVFVRLSQASDTLWLTRGLVNYDRPERSSQRVARFFTDRSIYRPGQTVYFKAVLLNVNPQGIPAIVPNTKVTVIFYDANGQVQNKLDLRSNAFGTVQGAFQTPVGGLTGGMYMQAEGWDESAYFNVEEYKRPRFEVTFKPVEGAFRLEEAVTVRGVAKNYAGNPVDGAELRYRVVRSARFPYWNFWFRRFPWNSSDMEIANGVATTDAAGNFTIVFPALPDRSIPEKEQPLFDYTVYADVTDISGETRSGQQMISLGYAALRVELPESNTIHLDSLAKFEIKTRNLAGQFQAASGNITLQRLVKPAQWYNNRYWKSPDQWVLSESDYKRDFPDYAWKEADLPINWERADFISVAAFNTEQSARINLQTGQIRPGYYLLTLEATDPYG
ncbi:MAG: MG2 domain-containing protein, partial [Saprospiraceae bacterium]